MSWFMTVHIGVHIGGQFICVFMSFRRFLRMTCIFILLVYIFFYHSSVFITSHLYIPKFNLFPSYKSLSFSGDVTLASPFLHLKIEN